MGYLLFCIKNHIPLPAYYLPKDAEDYQFCYVDQDGKVRGTSAPFQFRSESEEDMLIVTSQVGNLRPTSLSVA